jgi:REP element-mobilizing transposase RayT
MKQLAFELRSWGGKRKGAGRKPKGEKAGMAHVRRPSLEKRRPVHVTVRMERGVWNLRTRRCFGALAKAFWGGREQFGFRLVHYSVQGNHIHLLVEAHDRRALARGMKGLGVRIARRLNRVMGRRGRVLADRYHARVLRTLAEVRNVRNYLTTNAHHHYGLVGPDRYTSTTAVVDPETHLLRLLC